MAFHDTHLSFNGGEISPYLLYRNDFAKHANAAATMRNFLPLPFGSFSKRPGLAWLAETEIYGGENSRSFPFITSDGSRYILHFTEGLLSIYRATDGSFISHLTVPDYASGAVEWDKSLRALVMIPINDVAFFLHPEFHPLRLESLSDEDWVLDWVPFERAPMLDDNLDQTKTFTVASNPVAATWASGGSYAVGATAFTDCEWRCIAAHTSAAANKPGEGADWREYWRRMFYKQGDAITLIADDRSEVYYSEKWKSYPAGTGFIQPSYDTMPYDAAGLSGYTETGGTVRVFVDDITMDASFGWSPAASWIRAYGWNYEPLPGWNPNITAGDYYIREGVVYRCTVSHSKTDDYPNPGDNQPFVPGAGPHWALKWEVFVVLPYANILNLALDPLRQEQQLIDSRVSHKGRTFKAKSTHYAATATEPGTGASWTTYWLETSRIQETFAETSLSPGVYFRISPERDARDAQVEIDAIEDNDGKFSAEIVMQGAWNLFTYGTWAGTYILQRSVNNGITWETIRSWQGTNDRNVADSGTEDQPVLMRLGYLYEGVESDGPVRNAKLVPESPSVTGYVLMDTYVGPEAMTGIANTAMLSGNTAKWAQGAFSYENGFPSAGTLFGSRLILGGTKANPVSMWFSKIDDFLDFETGTDDDAGIFVSLSASNRAAIRWISAARRLFIGTALGEWVCGSETNDLPITPSNLQVREYAPKGSSVHTPIQSNDGVFFLGRQGTRLYELASSEAAGFAVQDMSRLAEHLLQGGVSNMAYQATREPCLWLVTRAGNLLAFHSSRDESLFAWSQHDSFGGVFRDVLVFPSDTGDDEVFFVIDRGVYTHIERFPQGWQAIQEAGSLDVVEGFMRDGPGLEAVVSELKFLPVDMMLKGGTTHGRMKRAHEILLSVFQSYGGAVEYDGQTLPLAYGYTPPPEVEYEDFELTTDWMPITLPPAHVVDLQPIIKHDQAFPFTVRAVVLRMEIHEP